MYIFLIPRCLKANVLSRLKLPGYPSELNGRLLGKQPFALLRAKMKLSILPFFMLRKYRSWLNIKIKKICPLTVWEWGT